MSAHPLSVKAVVLHRGRVLLLVNERDEWDLPGGRPEAGEDHRTALAREVREETGLSVEVGELVDEHLDLRWVPVAELGESIAGRRLPAGYLGAIRQLIDQPRSPSERVV